MKKIYLTIAGILMSLCVNAQIIQTTAGSVDLKNDTHYGGYLQSNAAPGNLIKIIWYPQYSLYRICGQYDRLQVVKNGYTYVDEECNCAEAFPYRLAVASAGNVIFFDYNSSTIKPSAFPALDAEATDLKASGSKIEVRGYASSEGSAAHNMKLSKDRANAVKTYLVNSGVPAKKLQVKGYGETRSVADNSVENGRVNSRRVEFKKIGSTN